MSFLKDNKVILIIILFLGFGLRLWNINCPEGFWADEYKAFSFDIFKYHVGFFEALKTNCYAPLHHFYLKIWTTIFNNSSFMIKMSSLVPNLLGCFVMYHVGKNYQTKHHSIEIGLACACVGAISSFLIYFAQEARIYSLIFLLSSLVLLYSIKMYEFPCQKNACWLTFYSILLILEHTIAFVFVIFNIFGLIAFRERKKKNIDPYMPLVAGLILCLPLIPFLLRLFAHPTYISRWWSPFNWSNIGFFFTDLFSPVLKNLTTHPVDFYHQIVGTSSINIGFVLFALVSAVMALVMIIRSNIDARRINKYFLSVSFAVFLTLLITAIADKLAFLTKYYAELYPMLILMCAIGWARMNSRNSKITCATIYIFMTLFFILVSHLSSIKLV